MRTTCIRIVGALLLVATLISACAKGSQQPTADDISRTIKSFMAIPTGANAEALVRLLDNQEVSTERGNEILSILTAPRAIVRPSYNAQKPAWYVVAYPTICEFRKVMLRCTYRVFVNGTFLNDAGDEGADIYGQERRGWVDPNSNCIKQLLVNLPQVIVLLLEEKTEIIPRSQLPARSVPAIYSCISRAYIPVRFVSEKAAEPVHVFTDPNLDAKMRSAFYAAQYYWSGSNGRPNVKMTGVAVCFRMLPADVTFRKMFRDESGQLLDVFDNMPGTLIRERAGTSRPPQGCFVPSVNRQLKEFPLAKGKHEGHLVLIADPEGAYCDPRFTHIWGGTLELPMTLTVEDSN